MSNGTVPCRLCRKAIPAGARFCTNCEKYQHPVARFFADIKVESLVALLPIAALVFVFIKDRVTVYESDLRVVPLVCARDRVQVVASNLGNRAAVLQDVTLRLVLAGKPADTARALVPVESGSEGNAVLFPPERTTVLEYRGQPLAGVDAPLIAEVRGPECRFRLIFDVIAFDGEATRTTTAECPCPGSGA